MLAASEGSYKLEAAAYCERKQRCIVSGSSGVLRAAAAYIVATDLERSLVCYAMLRCGRLRAVASYLHVPLAKLFSFCVCVCVIVA
jgi:hypothetical protein